MFIRVYVVGTSSGVNVSGTIVFLKQSDNLKRTNKVKSGVPSADGTLKVSSFLWRRYTCVAEEKTGSQPHWYNLQRT